ncbi:MAG TPA: multicopper oxidase [Terriglobia bacterium]|nr:multicopper oxidase [Terriglobia bacterium]
MPITRRSFLQNGSLAAVAVATRQGVHPRQTATVRPALNPDKLEPFVDPLTIPDVLQPSGYRPSPENTAAKVPYYRIAMRQVESKVHRDLQPTRFWGFGSTSPGPTFETRSGEGLLVEWVNQLPRHHFLPIDPHIHGAEPGKPPVRAVVHVHGARTGPNSDGYPENWTVPGKSALYYYPNRQDAAMLWYHDHALGINRLNIYAGLLGVFYIRDAVEDSLNLPRGEYEVPLILCDRLFYPDGQLNYPVSPKPGAPWVPEVFGNAILVNGKLFPFLDVEARKVRFRVLNGSNSRFYHLTLSNVQSLHQIGCDQGLLPAPVELKSLALAPGERADLIIDFSAARGERIILKSDEFNLMQFRVSRQSSPDPSAMPATLRPVPRMEASAAVKSRVLSLSEVNDVNGNPVIMLLNGAHWNMPVTENPAINTTEVWNLVNLTDDSHPIHIHLVRFQILDRRPFDTFAYQVRHELRYRGPSVPPSPGEAGWKDTVQAHPGMVTRIIARFEVFTGRYVWHCHVLEHGDNEMMRPYDVIAASE